jgi:hypothetical protein
MQRLFRAVLHLAVTGLTAAVCTWFFTGCRGGVFDSVKGNGNMVEKEFEVLENINTIEISKVTATYNISNTASGTVSYTIDENLEKDLSITLSNGILKITSNTSNTLGRDEGRVVFEIGSDTLLGINASGNVTVNGAGTFHAGSFSVNASGSCDVSLDIDADTVDVDASGSADIRLTGVADELSVDASGSFELLARGFSCKNANLKLSGSCDAEIRVSKKLDVDASGSCDVKYFGSPEVNRKLSGSCKVTGGD